jgi:hypothetical protein
MERQQKKLLMKKRMCLDSGRVLQILCTDLGVYFSPKKQIFVNMNGLAVQVGAVTKHAPQFCFFFNPQDAKYSM